MQARNPMRTGVNHKSADKDSLTSVARTLETIKHYDVRPEEIDEIILHAINVCLCLESDGDDHVAEGFNNDIVINGRNFGRR
jgi:hypothetical protein